MSFKVIYNCYSTSMLPFERPEAEHGGKIFLPSSALDRLSRMDVSYPMLFKLRNNETKIFTHCGVLEFIADEGNAYVPYWMMNNLFLEEGSLINIEYVTLPLASYAKFEPQSVDFLDISDPKTALEAGLSSFATLSVGEIIPIYHDDKIYEIKVLETKPDDAIMIIDCDMSVDFSPPVGYVEPKRVPTSISGYDENVVPDLSQHVQKKFKAFEGQGVSLGGKSTENAQVKEDIKRGVPNFGFNINKVSFIRFTKKVDEQKDKETKITFTAFQGEGHTTKNKHQ